MKQCLVQVSIQLFVLLQRRTWERLDLEEDLLSTHAQHNGFRLFRRAAAPRSIHDLTAADSHVHHIVVDRCSFRVWELRLLRAYRMGDMTSYMEGL